MAEKQARSVLVTVFGVVGTACFGFLALEYVIARYGALEALVALPPPLGLGDFLGTMPDWSAYAVTSGIWLGLLGAVLLLLVASLVASVWGALVFVQGQELMTTIRPLEYVSALLLGSFGLWLYARTAKRYGRL